MTHTPSEYFNIPFCRGQNGNMEKFKALGRLPYRESEIVAGFRKKSITRCVHSGLFKKCGEKSTGLEVRSPGH